MVEMASIFNGENNRDKILNKHLKTALVTFTNDNKDDWDLHLPYLTYKMNTTPNPQNEMNCCPYALMYGRRPPQSITYKRKCNYSDDENNETENNIVHSIFSRDNNDTKSFGEQNLEWDNFYVEDEDAEQMSSNNKEEVISLIYFLLLVGYYL